MMKTKNPTFVAEVDLLTNVETMKASPICSQKAVIFQYKTPSYHAGKINKKGEQKLPC